MSLLPSIDQIEIPKTRPTIYDTPVSYHTALSQLDSFKEWFSTTAVTPGSDTDIVSEIGTVIHGVSDAFEMARRAKSQFGWPSNEQLVDLFKKSRHARTRVIRALTGRWLIQNGIQRFANVGDKVSYLSENKRRIPATVVEVDAGVGQLLVRPKGYPDTLYRINYEDLIR